MLKMSGCILIIVSCAGIGYVKAMELQKHFADLQMLRQLFLMLRSEIKCTKAPLGEAFWHISRRMSGSYGKWLARLSKELEEKSGRTFQELWNLSIEECLCATSLSADDIGKLKAAGSQMGYLDEEMQLGTIDLFLEQLEAETGQIRENLAGQKRLCNCLGILGGLFLAVLLI